MIVVLQPKDCQEPGCGHKRLSWEEFIEQTAGCWEGEFIRDQGRFEERFES